MAKTWHNMDPGIVKEPYVKDVASILKKYTTNISWSGIFGTSSRESYNLAHPYNHIHGTQNLKDSERAIIVTQERLLRKQNCQLV